MSTPSLEDQINLLKPGPPTHEDKKFWREQLIRFEGSRLSLKKYCQVNSVSYSRFQYWRQKLISDKAIKAVPVVLTPKAPATVKPKPVALCQLSLKQGHELIIYDRGVGAK
jgi:hypothetical protein